MAENQIEVLSQIMPEDEGEYRIRAGARAHCFPSVSTLESSRQTLCAGLYLPIPKLPSLPDSSWTKIHIIRSSEEDGALIVNITRGKDQWKKVGFIWNKRRIDILSLPFTKRLKVRRLRD